VDNTLGHFLIIHRVGSLPRYRPLYSAETTVVVGGCGAAAKPGWFRGNTAAQPHRWLVLEPCPLEEVAWFRVRINERTCNQLEAIALEGNCAVHVLSY
jgi:hypothetical protein